MKKRTKRKYGTGIKVIISLFDVFKFTIRIADFDDTFGVYYSYYFSFKIFGFARTYMKKRDNKGRKIKVRYKA